jgi:uncharacterized ion transporter superfamily protein YfcC
MCVLGMAKLSYEKWFKFIWPFMALWTLAGSVMVYIAAVTGYGPF